MAYQDYINCSREALLEKMTELLPEKRLTHCLGVERAAIELAQRFGVDVEKAGDVYKRQTLDTVTVLPLYVSYRVNLNVA